MQGETFDTAVVIVIDVRILKLLFDDSCKSFNVNKPISGWF
jgi:hypothetical protein